MRKHSYYDGATIVLTTKHSKFQAVEPNFRTILNSKIEEYNFDTDTLGTFSGEVKCNDPH